LEKSADPFDARRMKYVSPNGLFPGRVPTSGYVLPVLTRRRTSILIRTLIRFLARKSPSISHPSRGRSSRFLSVSHLATGRDRLLFSSSETRSRTRPSANISTSPRLRRHRFWVSRRFTFPLRYLAPVSLKVYCSIEIFRRFICLQWFFYLEKYFQLDHFRCYEFLYYLLLFIN